MITEITIKKNKFGNIISSFIGGLNTSEDAANLESMNAFSAFVAIHVTDPAFKSKTVRDGVSYVYQKTGPKLKPAIGHYISQIRGDQTVAFVKPSVRFLEDITRVYQFAASNRMERAYGFFVGSPEDPSVVAFTGAIMPHLFHAVPDQMEMTGDWLNWLHKWAPKAMMHHRYFDANSLVSISHPEKVPAESYKIEDSPLPESALQAMASYVNDVVVAEPAKKKPGRPKKQ